MSTRWLETDTLSNQNISSPSAVGVYTADADRWIGAQLLADQVAGNGDYVAYLTLQVAGAGSHHVMLSKTTMTAAAGETAIGGQTTFLFVRSGDVVTVYIGGLAGDTTTPGITVRWAELDALRSTTPDRTLDVSTTGEAGLDFDNIKQATAPTTLSGITVPIVTTLTNAPAATVSTADKNEIAQKVWNNSVATTRTLTTPVAQIISAIENSALAIARNVDFDAVITGLSIPASWTKIYATIKRLKTDIDAKSQLQVAASNPYNSAVDGLVFINQAAAGSNRTKGALVVSTSGTIAWSIEDDVTSLLEVGDFSYDVKAVTPSGTILLAGSTDALIYDTETRALS